MDQISLRDFQLHAADYIDKLPFILTRRNLPVAIVNKYVYSVDTPSLKEDTPTTEKSTEKIEERKPSSVISDFNKCERCGFKAELTPHTVVFEPLFERTLMNLCQSCVNGARRAGALRDE